MIVTVWILYSFSKPFQGKQGRYCCFAQFSEGFKEKLSVNYTVSEFTYFSTNS